MARALIEALPKLPSHYCRQHTDMTFLEGIDSKSQLYRLFQSYCDSQNAKRVCRQVLFKTLKELNVGIQKPRKDQCNVCLSYTYGHCSQDDHDKHMKRKNEGQEQKKGDKQLAENDEHVLVFTVDLQQVLLAPRIFANANYFKSKLCYHNFTVYDLATRRVTTLRSKHHHETFILSSSSLTVAVTRIETPLSQTACFWQQCKHRQQSSKSSWKKGHTWMEADSVHSAIERKLLNRQIYWPAEYIEVITSARTKPEPYHVKNLTFEFFLDFSKLSFCKTIRPGRRPGDPQVTDIRALKYGIDGIIQYKLHHSDEWSPLPSRNSNRNAPVTIPKMYSQPIPIKKTKFEDLQQLKEVLPREYHTFYDQLPHQ
ncbi:hypothetical protein BaRGS_00015499 [Batillaria attramentaria]|uniref:Uncharacterized protein n=1 Tax=Batillaria attramentaria TaxID=370345 RepID=A0ABD0L1G1_9CAEN